jgi:hypothetical protein
MDRSSNSNSRILLALAAGSMAACVYPAAYTGTGVLNISGQPQLLSPVSVKLASCRRPATPNSEETGAPGDVGPVYAVLAIGNACRIEGSSVGSAFYPNVGGTCALDFAEGRQTVHVTSAFLRYGQNDQTVDPNYVEVEVGGDDVATGRHVLYRFSGAGVDADPSPPACPPEPVLQATTSTGR